MGADESPDSRLERLRAEQVRRWQRGEQVRVEVLLSAEPEDSVDSEGLLDLIYGEVLLREERGEHPTADEYVARFPTHAEAIQRQFVVHSELMIDQTWQSARETSGPFPPTAWPRDSAPPDVPDYEILGELGRGGMGVVYKARHRRLKRTVALKLIRDRTLADAVVLARFRAEAEAVARLQHPNIVQIYDCGDYDGVPYLSLEYVAGGSLEAWTCAPLHSVSECVLLLETIARAVGYAHQQQIVHRDLKPANILLADGQPKITDFGLAKQSTGDSNLTHSEAILGTGAYMSPEQAWGRSRDVGPPSDVHALGVILYELLTGETPFRDESLMKTLDRVRFETPRPPSHLRPEIPAKVDAICLRCLRKSPTERYATADQLADDLRRYLNDESLADAPFGAADGTPSRRRRWLVGAGSLLLTLGAVWGATRLWRTPPVRTQPETFAFLVGVRSYELDGQRLDLAFTESDVDELSRVLLKHGVPRRNIRLLTQWSEADNPDLAPTADNIRRQLRTLLAACVPGDTVLVAVTGVGGEAGAAGAYCYLPADARTDQPSSVMSIAEFYQLFRDCQAECKLLLVDTCQTTLLPEFDIPEPTVPPGVAALFACSRHEASYEDATLRHGVFSYHVIRGLEGAADTDGDGVITIGELHRFTKDGVQAFLREHTPDAVQTPALASSLDDATAVLPAPRS